MKINILPNQQQQESTKSLLVPGAFSKKNLGPINRSKTPPNAREQQQQQQKQNKTQRQASNVSAIEFDTLQNNVYQNLDTFRNFNKSTVTSATTNAAHSIDLSPYSNKQQDKQLPQQQQQQQQYCPTTSSISLTPNQLAQLNSNCQNTMNTCPKKKSIENPNSQQQNKIKRPIRNNSTLIDNKQTINKSANKVGRDQRSNSTNNPYESNSQINTPEITSNNNKTIHNKNPSAIVGKNSNDQEEIYSHKLANDIIQNILNKEELYENTRKENKQLKENIRVLLTDINELRNYLQIAENSKKDMIEMIEIEKGKYQNELKKFQDKIQKFKNIQELYISEKSTSEKLEKQLNNSESQILDYKKKIQEVILQSFVMLECFSIGNIQASGQGENFSFENLEEKNENFIQKLYQGVTNSLQILHPFIQKFNLEGEFKKLMKLPKIPLNSLIVSSNKQQQMQSLQTQLNNQHQLPMQIPAQKHAFTKSNTNSSNCSSSSNNSSTNTLRQSSNLPLQQQAVVDKQDERLLQRQKNQATLNLGIQDLFQKQNKNFKSMPTEAEEGEQIQSYVPLVNRIIKQQDQTNNLNNYYPPLFPQKVDTKTLKKDKSAPSLQQNEEASKINKVAVAQQQQQITEQMSFREQNSKPQQISNNIEELNDTFEIIEQKINELNQNNNNENMTFEVNNSKSNNQAEYEHYNSFKKNLDEEIKKNQKIIVEDSLNLFEENGGAGGGGAGAEERILFAQQQKQQIAQQQQLLHQQGLSQPQQNNILFQKNNDEANSTGVTAKASTKENQNSPQIQSQGIESKCLIERSLNSIKAVSPSESNINVLCSQVKDVNSTIPVERQLRFESDQKSVDKQVQQSSLPLQQQQPQLQAQQRMPPIGKQKCFDKPKQIKATLGQLGSGSQKSLHQDKLVAAHCLLEANDNNKKSNDVQNLIEEKENKENNIPLIPEEYVIAKYDYKAQKEFDLNLQKNDKIQVLKKTKNGWYIGLCKNNIGYFPMNFVEPCNQKQ